MLLTSFHVLIMNLPKLAKHVTHADSAIKGHLDNCVNVEHLFSIDNLILNDVNKHECRLTLVRQNTGIIDQPNNWNVFLFEKVYHIEDKCPILNNGVKGV